jgi:hypothetical protein
LSTYIRNNFIDKANNEITCRNSKKNLIITSSKDENRAQLLLWFDSNACALKMLEFRESETQMW